MGSDGITLITQNPIAKRTATKALGMAALRLQGAKSDLVLEMAQAFYMMISNQDMTNNTIMMAYLERSAYFMMGSQLPMHVAEGMLMRVGLSSLLNNILGSVRSFILPGDLPLYDLQEEVANALAKIIETTNATGQRLAEILFAEVMKYPEITVQVLEFYCAYLSQYEPLFVKYEKIIKK